MDFAEKSFRVFKFRFRSAFSSVRLSLLLIMVGVFVYSNVSPIADMSAAMEIPVRPWAFPHLVNDLICQLVFMAAAVVLFCDAPFTDEATIYFKYRSGRVPWSVGHTLYIAVISFIFVLLIQVVSILALLPQLDFQDGWGKIWGSLGKTTLGNQYGINFSISDYLVGTYTPLVATIYSFLLEWACAVWLGYLSYAGNLLTEKPIGTFLAAGFVLLDVTIYNEWTPAAYAFSPITLAQLSSFAGKNQSYGITLDYAVRFFIISICALFCICAFGDSIRHTASQIIHKARNRRTLHG